MALTAKRGTPPRPIYLDYNATTPVAPEVVDAMLPYLREHFGNPSSAHFHGAAARAAVDEARAALGELLNADPLATVFTSGGTESNNLAIQGVVRADRSGRRHLVTSAVEHPAVLEVFRWLGTQGFRVSVLPVDETGRVRLEDLQREVRAETLLVSVMLANNEVGTIQPVREIAEVAHRHGALMHTDAAQAVGKIPVDVGDLDVDLLTVVGHKVYGPKGVGALFIRPGTRLASVTLGASHEQGLRPGTEAVHQIVGLGAAARLAGRSPAAQHQHLSDLRDRLEAGLRRKLGGAVRTNGRRDERLPNTLSASFRGVRADELLTAIADRVSASAGSACHASQVHLSPVLRAMGVDPEWGMGTLRLSAGRYTTPEEVDEAVSVIAGAVAFASQAPATGPAAARAPRRAKADPSVTP